MSSSSSLSSNSTVPTSKHKGQEPQRTYGKKTRMRFQLPFPNNNSNGNGNDNSDEEMFFPDTDKIDLNAPPKVPTRPAPRSQKEAMMAVEPPEDAVQILLGLGKTDNRDVVVRYLKAKHNNIENAAAALLDDEDISQAEQAATWDDSVFSAGREGETDNQYLHAIGTTTPHTRANSPAGNRANLHPSSKDQEDADFAAAMAASQQDLGMQESGVIKSDGSEEKKMKHFGPATRDSYEKDQWALVPTLQDTAEVIPEVELEQRKNVPREPRFLKHVPNGDYLSAFLTICHAIAGVREAMLMREHVRAEYGQDADWWRGHAIPLPRIVYTENGAPAQPNDKYDELVAEVQRLMAFLDAGDRSYVSPGALTQTAAIRDVSRRSTKSGTLVEHFVQEWMVGGTAKSEGAEMGELFTTTVFSEDLNKADDCERFLLNLPVSAPEGTKVDLSELLDACFWGQDTVDDTNVNGDFVNSPADVIVMRLVQEDKTATQLRAEIPAEFYMDKYLRENREAAHQIRQQIAKGKGRLRKIEAIERKLTRWRHPIKREVQVDARLLLEHTHGHFAARNQSDTDDQANTSPTVNGDMGSSDDITSRLATLIHSIDTKLTVLASEKEKTRQALSAMSKNPFLPSALPNQQQVHKYRYTLRGVSTKPHITYILRPLDDDDDEDETLPTTSSEDGTPDGMQWWRIDYDLSPSGTGAKITKTRTPDYDVLRAVELEHREALLVYASDDANDIQQFDGTLPEGLREFVRRDNGLFKRDLIEGSGRNTGRKKEGVGEGLPPAYEGLVGGMAGGVRQSIEVGVDGAREGERDSMDSTRAQGGAAEMLGEEEEGEEMIMFSSDDEDPGSSAGGLRGRVRDREGAGAPPEYGMESGQASFPRDLKMGQVGPQRHSRAGLVDHDDGDGNVVEIRLDDHDHDHPMVSSSSQTMGRSDAMMSQDAGVGGSSHVEDLMDFDTEGK